MRPFALAPGRHRVGCHGSACLAYTAARVKRPCQTRAARPQRAPKSATRLAADAACRLHWAAAMSFDPLLGTQVGPYRLLGLIGVGGMSRVYVGRHQHLGRRAAVKLLSPNLVGDSQSVSRFFHEARAAAEAQSPHVVEIYDFIWDPKQKMAAYVMELLRGRDLRQALQL